jgi:hypothetical protein
MKTFKKIIAIIITPLVFIGAMLVIAWVMLLEEQFRDYDTDRK